MIIIMVETHNTELKKILAQLNAKFDGLTTEVKDFRQSFDGYVKNSGVLVEDSVQAYLGRQKTLKIGDIKFDSYERSVEEKNKFEIDFVLENGKYLGLIEVKRRLLVKDIDKFFDKTLPKYKKSKLYSSGKEIIPIFFFRMTSDFNGIKDAIDNHIARHKINSRSLRTIKQAFLL